MQLHDDLWHHILDIMVEGDTQPFIATQASAEQKRDLWPHLLSLYPDFDEYQARTDRDIPVFICTPTAQAR